MHRQFVRLLFAILLILIAISVLQVACITVFSKRVIYSWSDQVFEEFASNVEKTLSKADVTNATSIYDYVFSNASERISGFVLRSTAGGQLLTFGQSGDGSVIPQLVSSGDGSFTYIEDPLTTNARSTGSTSRKTTVYELPSPQYELDVTMSSLFSTTIDSVSFHKTNDTGRVFVSYPSSIRKADIAGTISVYINGSIAAYLDVLVYSVDYYTPTKFILQEVYKALAFTIPLIIIVGSVLAYVVSRRTERNVKNIEKALSLLSSGHFDVTVPDSKVIEYNQIGSSIEALGKDLRRHSASRKEWIRNISHDLNTPVTSMNMILEGVSDGLFPLTDEIITTLRKENDTLKERIASVSYYSYLLSPDAKCEKRELVLKDEIDTACLKINTSVRCIFKESEIVYADDGLITRALEEILRNAEQYRTSDSLPEIETEEKENNLIIKVSNDGTLPKPLPQFFEPWSRGDQSRTGSAGSGLGLSIVYQIMELHNGEVDITEDEEKGKVTVTLSFPCLDYVSVV